MTASKFPSNYRLLSGVLALCCVNACATLYAETIVFQFRTTIDASPAGGPVDAPLVMTYAFDSNLQSPPDPLGFRAGYGPLAGMVLQIGDQVVTYSDQGHADQTGPASEIEVNLPATEDVYGVLAEEYSGTVITGTFYGLEFQSIECWLIDSDAQMLGSLALPLTPDFAKAADFLWIQVALRDPATGNGVGLAINESVNTPAEQRVPFSLTELTDPAAQVDDLQAEVLALGLPEKFERGLLPKLSNAQQELAKCHAHSASTAARQIGAFINEVNAQSGKAIPAVEADLLIANANIVLLMLTIQP